MTGQNYSGKFWRGKDLKQKSKKTEYIATKELCLLPEISTERLKDNTAGEGLDSLVDEIAFKESTPGHPKVS